MSDSPVNHELVTTARSALSRPNSFVPAPHAPSFESESLSGTDYISFAEYWNVLLKRRWTVLTIAFICTVTSFIISFRMTPVYRATARVEVETEAPLIQSLNDLYQKAEADDAFLQTQIQVLKSDKLAWRTIEGLRLSNDPRFVPKATDTLEAIQQKVMLIESFKQHLGVQLMPKTRMLLVNFDHSDPQLAAQVATALVNNYVDYNFREKYDATRQASGWMEQQLEELKANVEKSQQALVDYERQNQMVNTGEKQNVLEQMLSDVSHDLTNAQSDRIQKESLYKLASDNRAEMATLGNSQLLQQLEQKEADLQVQLTEAQAQYGSKFPKAIRYQQQLEVNRAQIQREQNRILDQMKRDYASAVNRENLAAAAFSRQKEELGKLNQLRVQHNILQRDFESNQQLYQNLLQRLKDATVSAGLRSTNIHIVDTALLPTRPVRPNKLLNVIIGLVAGMILGVMGAIAQEALDNSVKTAEEVESLLLTPALVVIPLERLSRHSARSLLAKVTGDESIATGNGRLHYDMELTVLNKPRSLLAEAYRALRTAILLSSTPTPPKTVLVTSAHMGEGKTATVLNLAHAMAQRKGPVLVMDCDLRKGRIAHLLNLDRKRGLSTMLTGTHTLDEVLVQCTGEPNLWALPAGPVPPNPAELLGSDTMAAIWKQLTERFEQIIIDSPPVLLVTDATVLSTLADGVVIVAECGRTPRGALVRTRKVLDNAGARVLGVALNKLDPKRQGYYGTYSHYHYYHSYYRDGYDASGDHYTSDQ